MKKWLKRIRGAVGMGLAWAAVWTGVGAIVGVVAWVLGLDPASGIAEGAAVTGIMGFVAGATFSTVLGITEGRRRFDEMSLPRFAFWGAVGGLLIGVLVVGGAVFAPGPGSVVGLLTLLGAGSAAGSLALARRADDRELLEHGADVADIGLTEEEKRELLAG